jgi:glycosyltransferase involved in cell wall biosynthesis
MNILFVHEVDWLKKVVFDIHSLADALSQRGHHVYAIDYEDKWRRDSAFDFGNLKTRVYDNIGRALPGASVSVRRPGFIKIPGLSRLSAAFTHYSEIRRTIQEKQIEAIVLYSVPTNGLQTLSLGKKFHVPVLFRSIDILNMMVRYPALRPATRFLEKKVYRGADMVLPNTPQYLKYVSRMGAPAEKIRLLSFPINTAMFRTTVDTSDLRQKWGLGEDEPIIVFIGTLFSFSGMDGFLREFPHILNEVPKARLLIVGDGEQRRGLERIIGELKIQDRVTITGFQPYETMPQYISLATVCINPFTMNNKTIEVFPSKILQYAACGRATVATPLHGITSLLAGESHGVIYAEDAAGIASDVIALLKSPERRRQMEINGSEYVRANFAFAKITSELEAILEEAIKTKRHEKAS